MGNDHPRRALNTASLNGAKYINVSTGAQSYSIDQYEAIYHRPDIVKLAIKLGDTQQAIAQLTQPKFNPNPKIWIVNPQQGYKTERDRIQVKVETQIIADSAESLTFKVNGRPVGTEKSGKRTRAKIGSVQTYSRQVPLKIGENLLQVEIRGKAGAVQRSSIIVIRKGTIVEKPNLYYLGIGVAEHPQVPLRYPAKDVTGL